MRASASIPRFAGTEIPTLAEALDWAKREDMGIVLEIKEAERPDLAVDRVAALLEATGTADRVIVISFDHVVLKRAVERHPGLRTEAITHARHADLVGVLRACGASSVSIELDMFHPDDGEGAARCRTFQPRASAAARGACRILARRARLVPPTSWNGSPTGLIDTISGDDVPFIARLVERAGRAG